MTSKVITGECDNCESSFEIAYHKEFVSDSVPLFCPFCGERIDDVFDNGDYIDNIDFDELDRDDD